MRFSFVKSTGAEPARGAFDRLRIRRRAVPRAAAPKPAEPARLYEFEGFRGQ